MGQSLSLDEVMRAERVAFTYLGENEPVLEECSFRILRGGVTLIAGGNGSGKTTLCKLLAGAMQPYEGTVRGTIDSAAAHIDSSPLVGFVLEEADEQFVIGTVEDELAFAPENLGLPRDVIGKRVEEQLRRASLTSLRHRQVHQLSGGEKQRTAVASVLTLEPDVLIMDDAWSHMDAPARRQLDKSLQAWHQAGRTLILAVSRLDEMDWNWLDDAQLLLLHDRRIAFDGHLAEVQTEKSVTEDDSAYPNLVSLCRKAGVLPSGPALIQHNVMQDSLVSDCAAPKCTTKSACPSDAARALLQVCELDFRYRLGAHSRSPREYALHSISFQLLQGQCVILHGLNGSGKSTLFRILTGGMPSKAGYTSGTVMLEGRPFSQWSTYDLAGRIGFVAQHPENGLFADTVEEEIRDAVLMAQRSGRSCHDAGDGLMTSQALDKQVETWLEHNDLSSVRHLHPHDLPTGAKRLLSLTLAVIHDPPILLLDEPTAALDARHAEAVRDWCLAQAEKGRALIVATHDQMWDQVRHSSMRQAYMDEGRLTEVVQKAPF
ncbi:energy-coupling factor ABC transporter ATP-binding protein [Paenibacillus sp. MER TA 81-3]|uniref:ATP-binding cassette domain-containing protein n=1 Tax=Paenibacillus sp. MER TA 81-3 TaxID=2939573 RepID=UPI00203D130C|nr:ABC transporter ATP-binding protein [Paenibacillus sp. MER TA 81-3]MCM3342664.1 energy-coupling factor ABC transporter ATP-binding protein [Paenibacillus sp. MER TA 81-3]